MYVLCPGSQVISVIDAKTDKVIENILVGPNPTNILYNSANDAKGSSLLQRSASNPASYVNTLIFKINYQSP